MPAMEVAEQHVLPYASRVGGPPPAGSSAARVVSLFVTEALGSVGGTLLTVGIFFYTKERLGWRTPQNFLLAAVQGAVYVVGALSAGRLAARVERLKALTGLYVALTAVIAV